MAVFSKDMITLTRLGPEHLGLEFFSFTFGLSWKCMEHGDVKICKPVAVGVNSLYLRYSSHTR